MIPKYEPYFPVHHNFVSLFGGTGAEIGVKTQDSPAETFNDLDSHVFNVFAVLRDDDLSEQLIALIENTCNSLEEYNTCFDMLIGSFEPPSLDHAWAFLVCGNTNFVSKHPALKRSWGRHVESAPRHRIVDLPEVVMTWRERFKRVQVDNLPWERMLRKYDVASTFFFVDPPYPPCVISAIDDEFYPNELSMAQHEELLDALLLVEGRVMLCGYDSDLYNERLSHWTKASFKTRTRIKGVNAERVENIWMNYEADGTQSYTNSQLVEMLQFVAVEA